MSAVSIAASVMPAQTPRDRAWAILEAGAGNNSVDQRVATMSALQLIPRDDKALKLAENGLQDKNHEVRSAAALTLGAMGAKSAIPQLKDVIANDKDGTVVIAAAKALIQLGDESGYDVYYAVITGQQKSGAGLVADQKKQLSDMMAHPQQMEKMAFETGIGFLPFGGIGLAGIQSVQASKSKGPILKAASIRALATDQDPRTEKAIVAAISDESPLVRAAAYDALARRGHAAVLPSLTAGLDDQKVEVKLTAAAAVVYLSTVSNKEEK